MTSQSPPPARESGTNSLSRKAISYRWTLSDVYRSMNIWRERRSPCFSVLLKPATRSQSSWNSIWHLLFDVDLIGGLKLCLCQGWHSKSYKYAESCFRDHPVDCRKVSIRNCRFIFVNPETEDIVYSTDGREDIRKKSYDGVINNEDPCVVIHGKFEYDQYLFEDALTIQVEADLFFDDATTMDEFSDVPSNKMLEGIYSLYNNDVLTDAIIKCGGKEFKVHRVILASQSPVFQAMFEADMKEKHSGVTEVSDATPEAMTDLVTYLYTGTAPNVKTLASELLEAAEKYQLPRLLAMCEKELGNIAEATVIGTLVLADLHSRECLKKVCLEFIRVHSAKVFQTSEWTDFKTNKQQYSTLYMEVLECIIRA